MENERFKKKKRKKWSLPFKIFMFTIGWPMVLFLGGGFILGLSLYIIGLFVSKEFKMDFTGSEAEVEIVNVYYCNWGGEGDKAVCSMEPLDYAYEDKVLHVEIQDGGFYNAKACHITYRIDGEEQEASVAMYRDHFEAKDWKVVFHVRLFQENGDWSAEVIGYGGDEPGREIGNFTNLAEHPIEIGVSTEGFPCEENSRWD